MKKLVAVVAVITVLIFAVPGFSGFALKSAADERISLYNLEYSDYFTFELSAYEHRWFSSTAILAVQISESYRQAIALALETDQDLDRETTIMFTSALDGTLYFNIELQHGPLLFIDDGIKAGLGSAVTELDASSGDLNRVREYLGVPYLLRQYSNIGFSGVANFNGDIPPFVVEQSSSIISFSGLDYSGVADIYAGSVDLNIAADELSFDALAGKTSISGFSYSGSHQQIRRSVWVGQARIGFKSVLAEDALGEPLFNMQNLSFEANVDADSSGQLVNMDALYAIEKVTGSAGLDLADTSFKLVFGRVDLVALNELIALDSTGAIVDVPPEELRGMVYQLAAASPSVELGPLQTLWQNEEFDAAISIDLDGSRLPDYDAFSIGDTALWMKTLSGEAYINMTDEMARVMTVQYAANQIVAALNQQGKTANPIEIEKVAEQQGPAMLYSFTQQGLLKKTETGYKSMIVLKDGAFEINGAKVPLGL